MCQMDPLTTDTVSAQNSGETSHRHLVRGKHASLVVGAHTPGDAMLLHGDTTCTRGRQPVAPAPEPKLMRRCTRNNPTRGAHRAWWVERDAQPLGCRCLGHMAGPDTP